MRPYCDQLFVPNADMSVSNTHIKRIGGVEQLTQNNSRYGSVLLTIGKVTNNCIKGFE